MSPEEILERHGVFVSPPPPMSADDYGAGAPDFAALRPIVISPTELIGRTPPPREWIVLGWVPCGVVTGLYGDGGLGKSLIAQQLQTATSLNALWLGLEVTRTPSLGVYCEDSLDELWRRQESINASYAVDFSALRDAHWMPRLGEDNLLMTFSRSGVGELTKFHQDVLTAARDCKARLVVIDTAADTYGGNENDRGQVRQFVSRALGSIALKINGAVLLCAHPSRAGMTSGEGDGGSTGWSNSFRSRLFLRAPSTDESEQPDHNARVLQRRKANYASRNDEIRLRWRDGVIEPEPLEAPGMTPFGKLSAEDLFMYLLRDFEAQHRMVSEASRASNFAPRLFAGLPRERRRDYRQADFKRAMERLFTEGKIENVDYGRKGDERRRIVAAPGGGLQHDGEGEEI